MRREEARALHGDQLAPPPVEVAVRAAPARVDLHLVAGGQRPEPVHETRVGLEARVRPRELLAGWSSEMEAWQELRAECLLY